MKKVRLSNRAAAMVLMVLMCIVLCGASVAESTGTVWLAKPSKPTGWVNLRKEPSLESEGLARATLDQEVIVLDVTGEWARVIFDSKEGYMKTEFLEETHAAATYSEATITALKAGKGYEMKLYTEAPNPKSTVSIQYPHFSGNDALNSMIQQKIQEMITYPSSYYPQFGFTADYTATVTLNNNKMVSILFFGNVEIEKGRPGTVVASLNVDLLSMKDVKFSDLYRINKDFENVYFEKSYFPSKPVTSYDASLFVEMLTLQTREYSSFGPFNSLEDVSCFLKPDGIVISVPAVTATGSTHFEAQLNYSDIQEFYLPPHNYW